MRAAQAAVLLALSACVSPQGPAKPVATAVDAAETRDRAAAALATGRARQARDLYRGLLAQAPEDPEALAGLAEAERRLGEHGPALEHARDAAARAVDPALKARALVSAGGVLLAQGRTAEAEAPLLEATSLDAGNWRAWNALGQARDGRKAWGEAQDAYRRAAALAPKEGAVLNNLGVSHLSAGDYAEAADLFAQALALSPGMKATETNLRLAVAMQGRYDEALAGVAGTDRPEALNNAGYAALMRGDYAKARALLLQAIEASPSFYEPAWSNLRYLSTLEARDKAAKPRGTS